MDWMFDPGEAHRELAQWAVAAWEAVDGARAALERGDADRLTEGDRAALAAARRAVAAVRQRLRALDRELLGDAEEMLADVLAPTVLDDPAALRESA